MVAKFSSQQVCSEYCSLLSHRLKENMAAHKYRNGEQKLESKFTTKSITLIWETIGTNELILTGATNVIDSTHVGYFAAKASAMIQPIEWATKWKEFSRNGSITDLSIILIWSFTRYKQFAGFGLLPKPRRSTANILNFDFAAASGKIVSNQNEDEERNPCMKSTFSEESISFLLSAAKAENKVALVSTF